LFDLKADPSEWHNLIGKAECKAIEEQLKAHILEQLNPDVIDRATIDCVRKRTMIRRTMAISGKRWDVDSHFDPTRSVTDQYLPEADTMFTRGQELIT
jgi:hypothetical protein